MIDTYFLSHRTDVNKIAKNDVLSQRLCWYEYCITKLYTRFDKTLWQKLHKVDFCCKNLKDERTGIVLRITFMYGFHNFLTNFGLVTALPPLALC